MEEDEQIRNEFEHVIRERFKKGRKQNQGKNEREKEQDRFRTCFKSCVLGSHAKYTIACFVCSLIYRNLMSNLIISFQAMPWKSINASNHILITM